jgi:hypothetical protein
MGLDNLRRIINGNMGVEDAFWLDNNNGTLLTETMTTSEIHHYPIQSQLSYRRL